MSKHDEVIEKRVSDEELSSHKSRRSDKDKKSKSPERRRKDKKSSSSPRRRKDKKSSSSPSRRRTNHREKDGKKETKKVRFHRHVNHRTVPRVTKEDREKVWFTLKDREGFCEREEALQEYISSNEQVYLSIRDALHFEYVLTDEQESRIIRNRDESRGAVIKEQEEQRSVFRAADKREKFSLDWRKISKAYRLQADKALKEAQGRAAKLEKHLEAMGINLLGHSSPIPPSTSTKKGILRRHSSKSQKSLIKLFKWEIPRPPVLIS